MTLPQHGHGDPVPRAPLAALGPRLAVPELRAQDPQGHPAPPASPVTAWLERVHARHASLVEGAVATYIPELAVMDPELFGICLVTVDGAIYEVGDSRHPFTLQSLSKPLVYATALDAHGDAAVRRHIGVEPTGEAFNAITLAPGSGLPLNPMVNAGAITAASLIPGATDAASMAALIAGVSAFAGRPLDVNEAVFRSERDTGHRNRAIAHLLRSTGALVGDSDAVVDRYFRQCALSVDTRDLGLIAATLAAGGRHPLTGARAASEETVRSVLSIMATCGMYDAAGEWMYTVGLPAKSGVCGGIIAVLPGQLGIGVFSPRLDGRGNSVRGVAVCRDLSAELGLHLVGSARPAASVVRRRGDVAHRHSKRLRTETQRAHLAARGREALLLELQGDVSFMAAEAITRLVLGGAPPSALVLDLQRVTRLDPLVAPLLADVALQVSARGGPGMCWASIGGITAGVDAVDAALVTREASPLRRFGELDAAIEWCEEELLRDLDPREVPSVVPLAAQELVAGLAPDDIERLSGILERRSFQPGAQVVHAGQPARELFLVTSGTLSVSVPLAGGSGLRRLATLSAGMTFGELAFLGSERRTADVVADTLVEAWVLTADGFDRLGRDRPALRAAILENLLRIVSRIARRMTEEIALLAG
jgi:glutaminase